MLRSEYFSYLLFGFFFWRVRLTRSHKHSPPHVEIHFPAHLRCTLHHPVEKRENVGLTSEMLIKRFAMMWKCTYVSLIGSPLHSLCCIVCCSCIWHRPAAPAVLICAGPSSTSAARDDERWIDGWHDGIFHRHQISRWPKFAIPSSQLHSLCALSVNNKQRRLCWLWY